MCHEVFDEVLWALPRDALAYGGLHQVYDTAVYAQPGTFRQEMRIPDDIMPTAWKNNNDFPIDKQANNTTRVESALLALSVALSRNGSAPQKQR